MTKKTIGLLLAIIAVGALLFYAYLGGFRTIEISISERDSYHLAGHFYAGKYDRDTLKNLFFSAKEFVAENSITGTLAIVNYLPTNVEEDTVAVFIGVLLEDSFAITSQDWETRMIKAGKVISANIKAHAAVRPFRETVEEKIEEYALENGYTLKPFTLELYKAEDELQIDRVVE